MSMNPYRAHRRQFGAQRRQFGNLTGNIVTAYSGLSEAIVGAAISANDTLAKGLVTQIDGLHKKGAINPTTTADPIQSATCDFNNGDNVTLNEKILELNELQVNEEICRGSVYPTFVGAVTSRASGDAMSQEFVTHVLTEVAAKTAESLEKAIWRGSAAMPFGFLSNDGGFDAAGFAASALAGATTETIVTIDSAADAQAGIQKVYAKCAAAKPAVMAASDAAIYVGAQTYAYYLEWLGTQANGYANFLTNQDLGSVRYLNLPVHRIAGMPNNAVVLARKKDLFVGTNLGTDLTEVKYIPVYEYDGSDNIRVVMRMEVGVQSGIASDVIVGKTFA